MQYKTYGPNDDSCQQTLGIIMAVGYFDFILIIIIQDYFLGFFIVNEGQFT